MSKRFTNLVLGVFIVAGLAGCSKDSSPTEPKKQEAPSIAVRQIAVPQKMAQSSDPNALLAVSFINMANGLSDFSNSFAPPTLQKSGSLAASPNDDPTWFQTWTNAGLTTSVSIYDKGDTYVWEIRFSGTDGEDVFDNWLFIHAEQAQDRTSGTMTIYEPVTTKVGSVWTWGTDAENVYTLTMISNFDNDAAKIVVLQRPDNSGSLEYSEGSLNNFVLQFTCQWTAEGSGSWTTFDENGEQTGSGSWN